MHDMQMMQGMHDLHVERLFDGRLFDVEVITWSDAHGERIRREVVRHPGAVLIVPRLDDGRLVLVRNRRVAIGMHLLEFPAGGLGKGEAPHVCARRELAEETGYRCTKLTKIGRFFTSPGFADEDMHVFLAEGLTEGAQALEAHEELEVEFAMFDELVAQAASCELRDGKTIAALLLMREHDAQRDRDARPAKDHSP